jgi:hypothetical protein
LSLEFVYQKKENETPPLTSYHPAGGTLPPAKMMTIINKIRQVSTQESHR